MPALAEHRMDTPTDSAIDGVKDSLAQHIRCADRASAVATLDSALNGTSAGRPLVTMDDVAEVLLQLPAAYAELRGLVDANAQSGLESLARLHLRSLGIRVRTQVQIRGVGRVEVLIGDRLVLELDSRAHHLGSGYETDRQRDLELFRQGFIVLRVSYHAVMVDQT